MSSILPDPSEPEALATLSGRMGACVIDMVPFALIGALSGIATIVIGVSGVSAHDLHAAGLGAGIAQGVAGALTLGWWLTITIMQAGRGSVGQRICGIHAVDAGTGRPIGFWRSAVRNIVWALSCVILVGFFTPLFDEQLHRGWHDKASGALMVERVRISPAIRAMADPAFAPVRPAVPAVSVPPAAPEPPAAPSRPTAAPPAAPSTEAAPGSPAATAPLRAVPPPAPAISLIWDDGTRVPVHIRTVFGRNPQPQPGSAAVQVLDDSLSLSKTHFAIEIGPDSAYITDLNSTNGTVLVRSGVHQRLVPGVRLPLGPGDQLEFGDRFAVVGRS